MEIQESSLENNIKNESEGLLFLRPEYNNLYINKDFEVIILNFIRNNKKYFSLIAGIKNDSLISPFSAPFGGLQEHIHNTSIADYMTAATLLFEYFNQHSFKSMHITPPAACYGLNQHSKQLVAMLSTGMTIKQSHINHSLDLINHDFQAGLNRAARKSLNKANSHSLIFTKCEDRSSIEASYQIIKTNRLQRGYPLKLELCDLLKVESLTKVDYFIVHYLNKPIASAIVYSVDEKIGQVIYWGNDVEYNHLNPTHFLASNLFEHYQGVFDTLDIGPSTANGITNINLCKFKESLGCQTTIKYNLSITR